MKPRRRSEKMILAGDVGGTNARLRLYVAGTRKVVADAVLPSSRASSLADILGDFLAAHKARVVAGALGIAGPVIDGVVRTTNLPWIVDERKLARQVGIPKLLLINDLAAGAVGCLHALPSAKFVVAPGRPPRTGNRAVIAAGTGLGEALLIWDGEKHVPCATEGGHADFAPTSHLEMDLLTYLRHSEGIDHVSFERVLSGPGLGRLYDFFVERGGREDPAVLARLASGDRNAAITTLGLAGKSRPAADAVDLFARIYGAEAGNLAMKGFALGGLFLFGEIASRLLPRKRAVFLAAMRAKGRMSDLLTRVPVTVVKDRFVGLTGAGHLAARLAAG